MKVLIYSHIRLFSESLAESLKCHANVASVHVCYRAAQLIPDVKERQADVLLFDMLNPNSLEEARAFSDSCPNICLLALGVPETSSQIIACADAGFMSYIPTSASIENLIASIELALKGECQCDPAITVELMRELGRRRAIKHIDNRMTQLTKRERQVIAEAARGLSNKEIARELQVSTATIKNHLHNAFAKLGVSNRAGAVANFKQQPWQSISA